MKKFSFTKCGSSRYFYQVLWQFLSSRRSRSNFGGWPSPPQAAKNVRTIFRIEHQVRILQAFWCRLTSLGDQIVGNFGRKISWRFCRPERAVKENSFK